MDFHGHRSVALFYTLIMLSERFTVYNFFIRLFNNSVAIFLLDSYMLRFYFKREVWIWTIHFDSWPKISLKSIMEQMIPGHVTFLSRKMCRVVACVVAKLSMKRFLSGSEKRKRKREDEKFREK